MRPYNDRVVLDIVTEHIAARGRGAQTALAEALGVRPQTVNKWMKRQTCPEPDKWPVIERHFGLEPGYIAARAGVLRPAGEEGEVAALRRELAELRERLDRLDNPPGEPRRRRVAR